MPKLTPLQQMIAQASSLSVEDLRTLNTVVVAAIKAKQNLRSFTAIQHFSQGMAVEFTHPTHGTLRGTVKKTNQKTVSVGDVVGFPAGWRVAAHMLRAV